MRLLLSACALISFASTLRSPKDMAEAARPPFGVSLLRAGGPGSVLVRVVEMLPGRDAARPVSACVEHAFGAPEQEAAGLRRCWFRASRNRGELQELVRRDGAWNTSAIVGTHVITLTRRCAPDALRSLGAPDKGRQAYWRAHSAETAAAFQISSAPTLNCCARKETLFARQCGTSTRGSARCALSSGWRS